MIEPSGRRGLCQYTHNLANAIALRKHKVVLATSKEFETKSLPRKYEVMEVFNRFSTNPLRMLHFFYNVKKINPDVIHIQGAIHPCLYLMLWKIIGKISDGLFIYTSHDILPKKGKIYHNYILKQLYSGMSCNIVHSRQNKDLLLQHFKIGSEKIAVLSVGNNMALAGDLMPGQEIHIPENKKIILFFGIIEPQKGLMTLIKALPDIKKEIENVILFIAGQPFEDMSMYQAEIKKLNLKDAVKLKLEYIPLNEIPHIFRRADLVVLPYNQVSQSGVILSAYSFGKPVVATSVGGMPELVQEGKTGFLVPPDNPLALAKAVAGLLKDDNLREEMGSNALEYINKECSWQTIARQTEEIYHELLSSKSRFKSQTINSSN